MNVQKMVKKRKELNNVKENCQRKNRYEIKNIIKIFLYKFA